MTDDSSHNDGFVVRPLTEQEKRDLDVGDFFSRGVYRTPCLPPVPPRPTLWGVVRDFWTAAVAIPPLVGVAVMAPGVRSTLVLCIAWLVGAIVGVWRGRVAQWRREQ